MPEPQIEVGDAENSAGAQQTQAGRGTCSYPTMIFFSVRQFFFEFEWSGLISE